MHPACGQTASKATNRPGLGWTTRDGSPVDGSVNDAAPPAGTGSPGRSGCRPGGGGACFPRSAQDRGCLRAGPGGYGFRAQALLTAGMSRRRPGRARRPSRRGPPRPARAAPRPPLRRRSHAGHSRPGVAGRQGCACRRRRSKASAESTPEHGQQQRRPGEDEDDVRSGVVRAGVEADRQEQHQGQHQAAGRRGPAPQSGQRAQADGKLAAGDEHAQRHRLVGQRRDQRVYRAAAHRPGQLRLDRGRVRGVKETGVGQLLQAGEAEREPEEGAQRNKRQGGSPGRPGIVAGPRQADRVWRLHRSPGNASADPVWLRPRMGRLPCDIVNVPPPAPLPGSPAGAAARPFHDRSRLGRRRAC